jgi:5-methylcytosine-specific restriction endonuclease McrA
MENLTSDQKYKLKHKVEIKEYNKLYYQKHKDYWIKFGLERDKDKHRKISLRHQRTEECKKYKIEYRKRNKIRFKVYWTNRRSKLKGLTKDIVQRVYEDNIKRFGTLTCYLCFKPIEFGQDNLEHKIPLSRGGNNEYCNLDIAHKNCNNKKRSKTEEEYRKSLVI